MTMRSLLVFGLLMTLCTSASAATVNPSRTDYVTTGQSQGVASGFTVPTTLRFGKNWSGHSMYAYDPDCYDFSFRHPDYPWMTGCN